MPAIFCGRGCEYVKITCAEDECVENLGYEGDACIRKPQLQLHSEARLPSALLFE